MSQVITYQAPNQATITLSLSQIERLQSAGVWPRGQYGEYCSVSHGQHAGDPDYTDDEMQMIIEDGGVLTRAFAHQEIGTDPDAE